MAVDERIDISALLSLFGIEVKDGKGKEGKGKDGKGKESKGGKEGQGKGKDNADKPLDT